MKYIYFFIFLISTIFFEGCSSATTNFSLPNIDINYSKSDTNSIEIDPIDINIREKAWIEAEYNTNHKEILNAVSVDNIDNEKHSNFTQWTISGPANKSHNLVSGGYGWGYGYGYGSAYTYPTIEIVFNKIDVPDIDKINLGFSDDEIFMSFKYNSKRDIKMKTTDNYLIVWINLNNIPLKFINNLSFIEIIDN